MIQGYQFFKVFDDHQLEYILLAKGGSDDIHGRQMAAFQVPEPAGSLRSALTRTILSRTCLTTFWLTFITVRKLHIETNVKRIVFIIETQHEKDECTECRPQPVLDQDEGFYHGSG